MNWLFSLCFGAFSVAVVAVPSYRGWMPGQGGSWPLVLSVSAAAGALFGPSMRLLVPKESWRYKT